MNTKRIEEIQSETAYPDSVSVQQALLKVWNECQQEFDNRDFSTDKNSAEIIESFKNFVKKGDVYSTNEKWDIRFMNLAKHISEWSKDPSTGVGAIIVDKSNRIVSLGFNGYPQNVPDDDLHNRERKIAKIIHGEINAILFAKRDLNNCTIYVFPMAPCSQCASAIIQSGIKRVVTIPATSEQYKRWGDKIKLTEEMFIAANIELVYI